MKIGIIANTSKSELKVGMTELVAMLPSEVEVVYEIETLKMTGEPLEKGVASYQELSDQVDVLLVLGGDGTILHTIHNLENLNKPIASVNFGHLGFLTSGTKDELVPLIPSFIKGDFRISERSLLHVAVEKNGEVVYESKALNEVSISRFKTGKMAAMDVSVDDQFLNHYLADGILFATPTGSTAYSLSAGGPIMSPKTKAILLSPICPHSLSNRPVVVSDESVITLVPDLSHEGGLSLSCDGSEPFELGDDCRVIIKKHQQSLRIIRQQDRTFYQTLRKKMHWYTNLRKPQLEN